MSDLINTLKLLMNNQYFFILIVIATSLISYILTRFIILNIFSQFFKKTNTQIDDILIEKGFFSRLSYIVPVIVIDAMIYSKLGEIDLISRIISTFLAIISLSAINAMLNAINEIHLRSKYSQKINIKSYIQIFKLIINLFGIIIVIAFLSGQSPVYLLSGLGALTAVLMLIFKDTILSFVSSIQITSNDLFKIGDWVEAPQFGADGDVVDIALHTIKIQNWDKTITTIPTHKLIDSSFKNWRGMNESGGRRIKRSINIDISSVKFCDSKMIENYKKINLLSDYIEKKASDINNHNQSKDTEQSILNGRALTNIGTYRAYIQNYLKNNRNIHQDMTFLVRQLSPSDNGLPLEIYVFSKNINWVEYESIQSDIFDHLIASVKEFDLSLFQNPSGKDFQKII